MLMVILHELTLCVTFFVGIQHFSRVLRICLMVPLVVRAHLVHIQCVVLHQIVVIEDALGPAGSNHRLVHGHIHDGLLIGTGQTKVGLLGARFRDIVVAILMFAAMVDVLLVNTLHVPAMNSDSHESILHRNMHILKD